MNSSVDRVVATIRSSCLEVVAYVCTASFVLAVPLAHGPVVMAQTTEQVRAMVMDQSRMLPISASPGFISGDVEIAASRIFSATGESGEKSGATLPQVGGTTFLFANVEFTTPRAREAYFTALKTSRVPGIFVLTVVDRFADVFIESDAALKSLKALPGLVFIDGLREVAVPPPPIPSAPPLGIRSIPEEIVRGGFQTYKGKKVIIAVVDSGLDFRHPDFIKYDAAGKPTSRLLYLWDTGLSHQTGRGRASDSRYPNKASIGTVFTNAELTAELRAATPTIPANDLDGHGTACASIATGNGNADMATGGLKRPQVVGVAPEADIIGVSLDSQKNGSLSGAYLINAVAEWLNKVAGLQPLVISNSWGGHYTGHDGQSVAERELNVRFPLTRRGRAILFAAGNEAELTFHASVNFSEQSKAVLIPWSTGSRQMKVYFDTGDLDDIAIVPANGTNVSMSWAAVNPITKQAYVYLKVEPGIGGVYMYSRSGKPVKADLYQSADFDSVFYTTVVSKYGLVGTPGTMENAITVGSYDWNDNYHRSGANSVLYGACSKPKTLMHIGEISCYSSPGPTRDGRTKPEIASPGQWFTSSAARVNGQLISPKNADSTGNYRLMNGTSAATPYTSGIVALMFEKKPALTIAEIKELFRVNASKVDSLGTPSNSYWGAGKLDYDAISRIFSAIK